MLPLPQPPAELMSLLEQLPGCRILMDREYRVVAANTHYVRCCGAGQACSVIGRFCYEVSHGYDVPCDRMGEPCPRQAASASGQLERCVHVHHSAKGAEHVEVEITPLSGATGEPSWFMEYIEKLRPAGDANDFVGRDPAFLHTLELIKRVATTDTSVLLLGETGTGKEVLARALHDSSRRAGKPFVVVDCAGLTESLFESELFGHERGAFTGALARKAGLVEAAAGGTLFVDEIGDIPLQLQVKLLRLLETGLFRRVGGTDMLHADFRLIAATHRDLRQFVAADRFRADLYYRVSAFPIEVPALRARPADIPLLAMAMLGRMERACTAAFTPAALSALSAYEFPGNVRELRNIVERASLLAGGETIDLKHLPESVQGTAALPVADDGADNCGASPLLHAEREALRQALRSHSGSRRELAARLGLSERTLYRKLRELPGAQAPARRARSRA
jgi:two-component system, NtrC family, response regulator HydG